ncbi:MAG TPA: LysR family transcriptional regulator [Thermoanaerobaculia bacterium]|nr:LysR family transcriptional regulator [Thermoanaerobaculia bacterium]
MSTLVSFPDSELLSSAGARPLDFEIRHLRLVIAVADTGTLTRAADRLHLTQSALSHQLRDVEERLRTPLFHRVGKRMILTQAGTRVLISARRVLRDLEDAETEVHLLAADQKGAIRITTECYTCYHWLPAIMSEFAKMHPGVELLIDVDATQRPLDAILDGTTDVAIMSSDVADSRVITTPLFDDEMLVVVSPEHPFAAQSCVTARELAGETLVTYNELQESTPFLRVLQPAGLVPRKHIRIRLTEALIDLVRARLGVAFLAQWAVARYLQSGEVVGVPLTAGGFTRSWKAVTLKSARSPQWLGDFVALVGRETARYASPVPAVRVR